MPKKKIFVGSSAEATWVSHVARDEDAYLIKVSNGGMLKTLGLLRSELSGGAKDGQFTTMKSERH